MVAKGLQHIELLWTYVIQYWIKEDMCTPDMHK